MNELKEIICTLIIPRKFYQELTDEMKEMFENEKGDYVTTFPAETVDSTFLGEYIQAFCEVVLIEGNPKYEVSEDTEVKTELYKLGNSEKKYCMLVDIKYSGSDKVYNDILYFNEISQSLGYYTFELLGDQTMMSVE